MIKILTYGSDPEVFIINKKSNIHVSAEGIVPGTKDIPHKLNDLGLAIQPDNVMMEFSLPVTTDVESFKREWKSAIEEGNKFLKSKNENLKIDIVSSALFSDDELNTKHAQTIGCSTDYNAWLREENPKVNIESTNYRWAGGHIHIGIEEPNTEKIESLVKAFDMFLTLPFVFIDPNDDRKNVYGTPGRFRFTPYGFENRTLSNYWLSNEKLIDFVFNQMEEAVNYINSGKTIPEEVYDIIFNVDKNKAIEFCNKYKINYTDVYNNRKNKRKENTFI